MGWSDDAARNRESWSRANTEYTGGGRPIGVDVTPAQLETARLCMQETGIESRYLSPEWARQWPAEEIWAARKR